MGRGKLLFYNRIENDTKDNDDTTRLINLYNRGSRMDSVGFTSGSFFYVYGRTQQYRPFSCLIGRYTSECVFVSGLPRPSIVRKLGGAWDAREQNFQFQQVDSSEKLLIGQLTPGHSWK
ncbi:hypothetical protein NDU88_001937 [Pleurodeles waltl]|uniref:Uncharacterized protein n=1 Tax=Pleurodeles waltl TaxID=8319 RepID=A0AAV7V944_PLEWA|nr:hypothetical protein NDU88_001937 [Pleurodeles waltl]